MNTKAELERDATWNALSDLCHNHHCPPGKDMIAFLDESLRAATLLKKEHVKVKAEKERLIEALKRTRDQAEHVIVGASIKKVDITGALHRLAEVCIEAATLIEELDPKNG